MAVPSFAIQDVLNLVGTDASQTVELPAPGAPTQAIVQNIGSYPAFVLLGSSSVSVTYQTGAAVLPGRSLALTISSGQYLAYIGKGALLNVALAT